MVVLGDAGDAALAVGVRLSAAALVALVAALVLGWSRLVPAALLLLGGAYATRLALDDPALEAEAALVAGLLLLTAELGYWSLEERERVVGDPGEGARRLALVTGLAVAAVTLGAALLAVVDLVRTGGLALDLLGATAAAAALLVILLLARRDAT